MLERVSTSEMCSWERDCIERTGDRSLAASMRCRLSDDIMCAFCERMSSNAADEAADNRVWEHGY
jgi:hypothetical protein